ncbi:hypothetical protein ACP70R_006423 [Stipagrostis hirtigluma subsp. patula]
MGYAGAKRKGASFPPPAACAATPCKRPSRAAAPAMEEWRDWASLHPDLMDLIAARVLAADVVDYMSLRAVCARWRSSAPSPRDLTLRDVRFLPRGWVALCDGDGVRPADACEVAFLHTATGRCLRVRLPELRGHRIVGFTDGLLILINKDTTAVRVLHPFTRAAVDLPPMAAVFTHVAKDIRSRAWMRAAVCKSQTSDSIAVVAWFPTVPGVVIAEPGFPSWLIVYHNVELTTAVTFQGRVYGVISNQRQVVQVYPQCPNPCIAHIPNTFGIPQTQAFFLVECAARLMLVLRYVYIGGNIEGYQPYGFALFEVDTAGHGGLTPMSSLGDWALFLGVERCLSVSRNNLPSVTSDAIFFDTGNLYPVAMYSVNSGMCEQISTLSIIHDFTKRIRPSVRPFTLADHLFTFCYHRQWSRGLMFHEYHCLPTSWKELSRKHKAQDREVQVKSLGGSSSRSRSVKKARCTKNNCSSAAGTTH